MTYKLQGTGVALVTPFDQNLQVDFKALAKLLQHTSEAGIDYWVVNGTTGESCTTQLSEKKAILQFIQANNPSKIPIVYGLASNHTAELLQQIDKFDFNGIDFVMSASPYYNKPSQQGIYLHYTAIADVCPVPILLYNVPSRTGCNINAETTIRLSKHPNIIGIKEASGNLVSCIEIAKNKSSDFFLISGDDILTLPIISIGGIGVISTLANAFPKQFCNMTQAALNNDYELARKYQSELLPILQLIVQGGNPVATKQILAVLDICKNYVRMPLVSLDNDFIHTIHSSVLSWVKEYGM